VTTGPWDPMAAGVPSYGALRASDADREQVIEALKTAFVQGLLSKDELDTRAGRALASRTCAELTLITLGIPAAPTPAQPPPRAARVTARQRVNKKVVARGACVVIVPPALGAAFLTYYGGFLVLFLFAFIGTMISATPSASRRPGRIPSGGRR
jgi:Domain of unknown function (DUF1707)